MPGSVAYEPQGWGEFDVTRLPDAVASSTQALRGSPQIIKYGVNYLTGLPGTVAGLLDLHANASGGLASSLDEE